MTLSEAAERADALAVEGDEKALATLRAEWDDEVEAAARSGDYRVRAQAYRAIAQFRFRQKLELLRRGLEDESAQFRFRQKLELLRRGLEDESPAARGSALIALEGLSRRNPGDVNGMRALLHELAARDPNVAVRRLAIVCLKNGSPRPDTIQLLRGIADADDDDAEVRKTARVVAAALKKTSDTRR